MTRRERLSLHLWVYLLEEMHLYLLRGTAYADETERRQRSERRRRNQWFEEL